MAKQVLPTNFQDDVLNASMNGKRRYMLLQQDDGSYILNDVTNYDTEGSTFGAAQINATNQAVNQSVDKDDVLNTSEEVEANVDEKKVTGALVAKQLISDIDERFPSDVRIIVEGSGEDVEYYAQLGADTASKKLLGDSSQILAIFHASTSSAIRYTADRKITGITMISEDVRTNTVQLRINNEIQTGVNIAQIDGGEFGCRVYDVTLNVGDEVAVTSSGGGGADMVLLSGVIDAAQSSG